MTVKKKTTKKIAKKKTVTKKRTNKTPRDRSVDVDLIEKTEIRSGSGGGEPGD